MASIEVMRLGLSYPQSQLKIIEKTDKSVVLKSLDESATFSFQVFRKINTDDQTTIEKLAEQLTSDKNSFIKTHNEKNNTTLSISDSKTVKNPPYSSFSAIYDKDGKAVYWYVRFAFWRNEVDKSTYIVYISLESATNKSNEYQNLLNKMMESLSDV
jgi:hypothetical protein